MKLYAYPYWKNMVAYYYGNDIQNRDGFFVTSIWLWLSEDFRATRTVDRVGNTEFLIFADEADVLVFKLMFR